MREKHRSVASGMHPTWDGAPNLGMCPDGNRTSDLPVHDARPPQLSHTGQSPMMILENIFLYSLLLVSAFLFLTPVGATEGEYFPSTF